MFSSSVRRVALTAPSPPITASLSHIAATTQAFSSQSHQRRFSSSKPSNPPANGVADPVTTAPARARPDSEKKARGSKKAKKDDGGNSGANGRSESGHNLPSVPSTQHISPTHISAADFFSLYRPISLTNSFPRPTTTDDFASIFTTRTRTSAKPSEVISTLASTVNSLTGNVNKLKLDSQQAQWNEETDNLRASITAESYRKAETKHLDGSAEDSMMDFPNHILSGKFHPFQPPPAPVPMDTAESLLAGAEAAEEMEPQHRTYTAVLTVEESTHANGEVTYVTHSTPLMAQDQPASRYIERMQLKYRERGEMMAISVKRQRKLKMKKHKYKKLMKRTRVLRRKLDRT